MKERTMIKKIILLVATLAIISIAFMFYQSREAPQPGPALADRPAPASSRRAEFGPRTTQPVTTFDDRQTRAMDITSIHIPAGQGASLRVFDPKTGRLKYYIRALKWEPVGPSGTEWAVTEPSAEVLLPRGQLAYVRADAGQVTVARGAKNEFEPKRGWFKGNVRVIVDRTTPKWREENPDQAAPVNHPEAAIKFWLDDVRFDLELANLFSDGPIRVESADGSIEGRGLELLWNEMNRRVTKLRIAEGGKATLRSSSRLDIGVAGGPAKTADQGSGPTGTTQPAAGDTAVADATTKPSAPTPPQNPDHPQANAPFNLVDVQAGPDRLKENRIDVYNLEFHDNIVAEQRAGMKVVGGLKAAQIKVLFEVGQSEREAAQHVPGTQPAAKGPKAGHPTTSPAGNPSPLAAGNAVVITWTGELVVLPEEEENQQEQKTGKAERLHMAATGNPVELFNRETGQAVCQELEYFHETKHARLTGTPEHPVRLASGADGELIGERVTFDVDPKTSTGIARVDGPGKLIFKRETDSGEPTFSLGMPELRGKPPAGTPSPTTASSEQQPRELVWQNSAEIHFGSISVPSADQAGAEGLTQKGQYLKDAVFDGTVRLNDPSQSMAAEHVEITFRAPRTVGDFARNKVVAEQIKARGGVHMSSEEDLITCESLEVELTVDEFGNNVPVIGRAFGNVQARQGQRKIEAGERIEIHLASVARPVSAEQRARLEAKAKENNIAPDSPEWKEFEVAFKAKHRRTVVIALNAKGGVDVRDPKAGLEVVADDLDCAMNNEQQITKATILGKADAPAHVQTRDFEVRGPRILMDVITQSAEVPGAGLLRFFTSQDLDGRPVDKPVPVVVTWTHHMNLDGQSNSGEFSGSVRASSESSTLDCRELTLRFQDLPMTSRVPEGIRSSWVVRSFLNSSGRKRQSGITTARVAGQLRKRLSYLRADGAASGDQGAAHMEIKAYDQSVPKTMVARVVTAVLPSWLEDPTKAAKPDNRGRMVSGAAVSGPRIAVDLIQQQLAVEGQGFLLIRDYHLPARRGRDTSQASAQAANALSSDSLTSLSPGHTGFTWLNGMSFLNQKNVAVFDRDVRMEHRSGSELEMSPELAAVTGLNAKSLAELKGRHVRMTSDHLLAEFDRDASRSRDKRSTEPGTLSRATRLKVFVAAGRVHMQEHGRSLDAAEVSYRDETGLVRATGTPKIRPRVEDIDEATGQRRGSLEGEPIEWNVKTGEIRVREPNVNALGR
jgi:hypothetical protein